MKQIVAFPLEDGTAILVEVEVDEAEGGLAQAGRTDDVVRKATQTFEKAISTLRPATKVIIDNLRSLSDQPDEIAVEFGLKLNAEADAYIAAVGAEANYKITLQWKRDLQQQ